MEIDKKKRINPTSSIKSGFYYQDLWGLKLSLELLGNPDAFDWINFETVPDESDTGRYYLDDIILREKNGSYHLYQIKHKENTETENWTWNSLLEKKKFKNGKLGESLLEKWFNSYNQIANKGIVSVAFFITNGKAEDSINQVLKSDLVNISKIRTEQPKVFSQIQAQLGNGVKVDAFFENFKFIFDQKDYDDLEVEIRSTYYNDFGATEDGVTNLLLQLHKEGLNKVVPAITIEKIKEWCRWDNPKPLNEKFDVPKDFQLFDETQHRKVLAELTSPKGGIRVIFGKPGSGKSTYLTKLSETLESKKAIVIKHHYFISPNDVSSVERLNSDRVIEAVKYQIKLHPKELGSLSTKNSGNTSLKEYIDSLAQTALKKKRSVVLIIDGLDYVLGYSPDQLTDFLKSIFYPQPGLWIVLGTQEHASQYFPSVIREQCPRSSWIEVKGLTKQAVAAIVEKNLVKLNLPAIPQQKQELVSSLSDLSQGNPLHLRYTLRQLKDVSHKKLVTEYDCRDLVPYDKEIFDYYKVLWGRIPDTGKLLSLALVGAGFSLSQEQLVELATQFESNPTKVSSGLDSISHLLSNTKSILKAFHNSFEQFLFSTEEYGRQKTPLKQGIKNWLEGSSYEDLKWSELTVLNYELGDPTSLLLLNRDWLVQAISYPREPQKIIRQLTLAARASFETKKYGKAFEYTNLCSYYENAFDFIDWVGEKIWIEAIKKNNVDIKKIDMQYLSPDKIASLCFQGQVKGINLVPEAIDILNPRHSDQIIVSKGNGDIPKLASSLINIIALDSSSNVTKVYNYIRRYENYGWCLDLLILYVKNLLKSGYFDKVQELFAKKLTDEEKEKILDLCVLNDLEKGQKAFLPILKKENQSTLSLKCVLYLYLCDEKITKLPTFTDYLVFPFKVEEFDTKNRSVRAKLFVDIFLLGLLYELLNKDIEVQKWIDGADSRWPLDIACQIVLAAEDVAHKFVGNYEIEYLDIFQKIAEVKPLTFLQDRDLYELQNSLPIALGEILELISVLRKYKNLPVEINESTKLLTIKPPYFSRNDLLKYAISKSYPIFSQQVYEVFVEEEMEIWKFNIDNFQSRAEHYIDLARLANIQTDLKRRDVLINLSASNFISYGYHKDLYLDGVLDLIKLNSSLGAVKTDNWVKRLAPIIENIGELTDGDETRYIPTFLAETIAVTNKDLLRKYYLYNAETENVFLAQDIFSVLIKSFDFSNEVEVGIGSTAIDKKSYEALREVAKTNKGASSALDNITDFYGVIEYPPEYTSGTITSSEKKDTFDFDTVLPKDLHSHIEKIDTKWDQNKFLNKWFDHWGVKSKLEAIKSMLTILDQEKSSKIDTEILDRIYPVLIDYNKEKAFEYVCTAQRNGYGWAKYYDRKEKTIKRWEFVKKYFPTRHWEFMTRSMTPERYGSNDLIFSIPMPRGIEFLLMFGEEAIADELTEASVKFAEDLMADLILPPCKWLMHVEATNDDVLIQRLLWPTPFVRERAVNELAKLIAYSKEGEKYLNKLLDWISCQSLEGLIVIGLLVLIKSLHLSSEIKKELSLEMIRKVVVYRSIVIDKLIDEISSILETPVKVYPGKYYVIRPVPAGYRPSDFFLKYLKSFVPPIYSIYAEKISRNSGIDFVKQWGFTFNKTLKEENLDEIVGDIPDFTGDRDSYKPGVSSKIGEVYRSSFGRVLQYFYENKLIPENYFLKYAYKSMPIDLSYWKVKPNRSPDWWPTLSKSTDPALDTSISDVTESVKKIIEEKKEFTVLGIDGAIKPAEEWSSKSPNSKVTVVGFAYEVTGGNMPTAEEVAESILNLPQMFQDPTKTKRPFSALENFQTQLSTEGIPIRVKDLMIYPIIARNSELSTNIWLWFRDFEMPFTLYNEFEPEAKLLINGSSWDYLLNGNIIAKSYDWLEGLREDHEYNLPIPHGHVIEVDSGLIEQMLLENKFRLGYVVKTTYFYKEYSYSDVKTMEDYQLINVSSIIL